MEKFTEYEQTLLNKLDILTNELVNLNKNMYNLITKSAEPSTQSYTIRYILNAMLNKKEICKTERIRKKNIVSNLLASTGLSLDNDYLDFYKPDIILSISNSIKARTDILGDCKRKHVRYIAELIKTANTINPEAYTTSLISLLADIKQTKKTEKHPHRPYSYDQLKTIFDPKYTFFKDNPDLFWICMIALFTGARQNAACTLQYQDICSQDGIQCIHFTKNHPIKQLKNESTERYVPIHPQLLNLGFVNYVETKKKTEKANDTDFIFSRCRTKSGNYNDKLLARTFTKFLFQLKIKTSIKDGYDFHSFRKNASLIMQDSHISEAYINDIIGWKPKTIMTQHYSNHTLAEINREMKRFSYLFLVSRFKKWKQIFSTKK